MACTIGKLASETIITKPEVQCKEGLGALGKEVAGGWQHVESVRQGRKELIVINNSK